MVKVALLYICTGKYTIFWDEFFRSSEQYLLPDCEKHYYVFTDAEQLAHESECQRIHRVVQEALPWPYASLMRFSFFLRIEDELKNYDYIYFLNANAKIMTTVSEEMLLPRKDKGENMVYAQHLAFYDKPNHMWTYDRNPRSYAYIPYGKGDAYVRGGVNGGKAEAFLKMCKVCDDWTNRDLEKDVVALWHDESYINKYAYLNRDYRLLSPEYVFPENGVKYSKLTPIIQMREKNSYFSVESVKSQAPATKLPPLRRLCNYCAFTYYDTRYLLKTGQFLSVKSKQFVRFGKRTAYQILGAEKYEKLKSKIKRG